MWSIVGRRIVRNHSENRSGLVGRGVAALLAALMLGAPAALGQDGIAWGDLRRARYATDHVNLMTTFLNLSDDQKVLVSAFLRDYAAVYAEIRAEADRERELARDRARWARESGTPTDAGVALRARERVEALQQRHEHAAGEFIANARAVLTPEQADRWPDLERALRRRDLLPRGEVSGERVDLFQVVARLELSEESRFAVEPLLADYAVQLDAALVWREQAASDDDDDAFRDVMRDYQSGVADANDLRRMARHLRTLRTRVRDVNIMFADQIRGAMTMEEEARAFEQAWKAAAFPRIYTETYAQRVLQAALAFEDLDPLAARDIEALAEVHANRLLQANQKIERLTVTEEPRAAERLVEAALAQRDRRRVSDDFNRNSTLVRDAYAERESMEAETILALHRLLTEEQVRRLPARRDRTRGR